MTRALTLDVTGTLITVAEPVGETYARIFAAHGVDPAWLDPQALEAAFHHHFRTLPPPDYSLGPDGDAIERGWWRHLVETSLGHPVSDAAFRAAFDHYASAAAWKTFPDARPFLDRARQAGLRLLVISNFDRRLHSILAGLDLAPYFEKVLCSAEARTRKPHPAIFRQALEFLQLPPHEVMHMGDSPRLDVDAARACDMQALRVDRPTASLTTLWDQIHLASPAS